MIPNLLSIAGSDPSGGAGVQADLKTFAAHGCHGMAAITALTAQNSLGVRAIHATPPDFLAAQIDAILDDIDVAAVKIGMIGDAGNARVIADRLAARRPAFVVLDPVLAASSGDDLGGAGLAREIMSSLLPLVDLITPNAPEAARLTGLPQPADIDGARLVARALRDAGAGAVLVKGGHVPGEMARDLLLDANGETIFAAPWVDTRNTHGTGCALSSAIAARVAHGDALADAIRAAKDYLTGALANSVGFHVGAGPGPLNHFWRLWPPA
jgi:hydroxymethylpyrimidine kinase/phosphomethylpyrimidine kinase